MGIMDYMKSLKAYLTKMHPDDFIAGSIYSDENTITYFPFTPGTLKKLKLKIAIVFNHPQKRFEIWLAGQNKQIQKKYWEIFKESDWNKYHIPDSIENGFSIVDTVLEDKPDFSQAELLTEKLEKDILQFTRDIAEIFEI